LLHEVGNSDYFLNPVVALIRTLNRVVQVWDGVRDRSTNIWSSSSSQWTTWLSFPITGFARGSDQSLFWLMNTVRYIEAARRNTEVTTV